MIAYKDFYSDDLNETPDVLMGKYPRAKYESYLFLATEDMKGMIWTSIDHRENMSHALMMRRFIKKFDVDNSIKIIGDITSSKFDIKLSGSMIPKQKGIENTLISLWDKEGVKLKPLILQLMDIVGAQKPAKLEITDMSNWTSDMTGDL